MQSASLPPAQDGAKVTDFDGAAERDAVRDPMGVRESDRSGEMEGTCPGDEGHDLLGYALCSTPIAEYHVEKENPAAAKGQNL